MRLRKTILLFTLIGSAMAVLGDDDTPGVALSAMPAAVQKTINSRLHKGGKVDNIGTNLFDGELVFVVDWSTHAKHEKAFDVADDGTLLSVEAELTNTPAAIQRAVKAEADDAKVESVWKEVVAMNPFYDVRVSKDGKERTFTLDQRGTLVSKEVKFEQTPEAVQERVRQNSKHGHINDIVERFDADGIKYHVVMLTADGSETSFTVQSDGILFDEQVTLADVSQGAAKTIREQITGGKIIRIDRSVVQQSEGVLPYHVQGRKDGLAFNFIVGPKGRFIGMDP